MMKSFQKPSIRTADIFPALFPVHLKTGHHFLDQGILPSCSAFRALSSEIVFQIGRVIFHAMLGGIFFFLHLSFMYSLILYF